MKSLYNNLNLMSMVSALNEYFSAYFHAATRPMRGLLCGIVLAMLALESIPSIRWMHRRLHLSLMNGSLNSYYRALKTCTVDDSSLVSHTVRIALSAIPSGLADAPLFLSVDDTIIAKAGQCFDFVSKLFDHAMHTGSAYVNGHCFVSLMLSVPIGTDMKDGGSGIRYLHVPVVYRLWTKEKTKLEMAADAVDEVMKELDGKHVFVLCDSWYPKKKFINRILSHENADIICNVRVDTAIYDLPPARTGKRGRPCKRGVQLSLDNFACTYSKGKFKIGHRCVKTKIFGDATVHAYVTVSESGARRLFICTAEPSEIRIGCALHSDDSDCKAGGVDREFLPLSLYGIRWNIEVGYYEHKTFWSLSRYMLRRRCGIERLLNLICITHAAMRLLPYVDARFAKFKDCSPQEVRMAISKQIQDELFLSRLADGAQNAINSAEILSVLHDMVKHWNNAA